MPQLARKLVGTALLVLFVPTYALIVAAFAAGGRVNEATVLIQIVFYAFFGLIWILPAGLIIRWMAPPRLRG